MRKISSRGLKHFSTQASKYWTGCSFVMIVDQRNWASSQHQSVTSAGTWKLNQLPSRWQSVKNSPWFLHDVWRILKPALFPSVHHWRDLPALLLLCDWIDGNQLHVPFLPHRWDKQRNRKEHHIQDYRNLHGQTPSDSGPARLIQHKRGNLSALWM